MIKQIYFLQVETIKTDIMKVYRDRSSEAEKSCFKEIGFFSIQKLDISTQVLVRFLKSSLYLDT